jgi:hypothetical protein
MLMFSSDMFSPNRIQVIDCDLIIGFIELKDNFYICHHQDGSTKPHLELNQAKHWFERPQSSNQIPLL